MVRLSEDGAVPNVDHADLLIIETGPAGLIAVS